jgi:hypothetical protein
VAVPWVESFRAAASAAFCKAAVSSVLPSPLAPKSLTLKPMSVAAQQNKKNNNTLFTFFSPEFFID